jgi:YVTN family beta-propeller protein
MLRLNRQPQTHIMKQRNLQLTVALAAGLLSLETISVQGADVTYKLLKEIPVGGEGGWDYSTVDPVAHRLYVSHGNSVVVVDLEKDVVVGEITNTPGVHGLAPAPDLARGLTTNGRENKASFVDLKTLETLLKADTGEGPDGMMYEPGQKEFYTFNGRGQSATVIDAKTGKVITNIPLGGRPEFAAVDPEAGRLYDNLEDKSEVAVIDTKTHKVLNTWPIAPGEEASGMAIDLAHHRIFCGCRNSKMVMLDTTTGKVVTDVPIGQGVDANAFDPGTQLAFASCRDGTVTIAHEDSPEKLTVVQTLTTSPGSRTMALDPTTHKIYLAAAKMEPPAEGQRRGRVAPGSFKVLVFGM